MGVAAMDAAVLGGFVVGAMALGLARPASFVDAVRVVTNNCSGRLYLA
jgi:hypothetical protein